MGSMSMYSSSRADRPTDSNVSDLEDVILGLGLCLGGSVAGRGGGSEGRREGAEGGRGGGGVVGQNHMHHHLRDVIQICSTAILHGRRLLCAFNAS